MVSFGIPRTLLRLALCLIPLPIVAGCNVVEYAAAAASGNDTVDASYKGLANQKVGVLVWADNGVLNDYKTIQLDTAKGMQLKLKTASEAKLKEVENVTWVSPEQVLQFQENHTDLDMQQAADVAPRLGVTRLIYIEVEEFATHPNDSPDLARGSMTATVQVVEVVNGKGKVAFSERGVNVVAPKKCPPEGLPNLDDDAVYRATVDTFTSEASKRFVPHEVDSES